MSFSVFNFSKVFLNIATRITILFFKYYFDLNKEHCEDLDGENYCRNMKAMDRTDIICSQDRCKKTCGLCSSWGLREYPTSPAIPAITSANSSREPWNSAAEKISRK